VTKRFKGTPFVVRKAVPVDLFPQTPHCELVLLLERE
jgi:tRNA/tmRNA/rRNA uracil-C5-methylase (TrmA/RlmC/RlmD family)